MKVTPIPGPPFCLLVLYKDTCQTHFTFKLTNHKLEKERKEGEKEEKDEEERVEDKEILHALRCVLGTSEAPFSCMHTVHTYHQIAIFI